MRRSRLSLRDDVPMEPDSPFDRCRRLVLADPALQVRLRELADWPTFTATLVGAAREHGIELTAEEVEAERRQAFLGWLARAV